MRARITSIALALTLILTGCSSIYSTKPFVEETFSALAEYEQQKLDWSSCYDYFDCAELRVPIDYDDLSVGTFRLAVLRAAAMAAVLLFAHGTRQGRDSLPALGFAIGAVVIADPFQARDPGFALSVLATAGLLFLAPKIKPKVLAPPTTWAFAAWARTRPPVCATASARRMTFPTCSYPTAACSPPPAVPTPRSPSSR